MRHVLLSSIFLMICLEYGYLSRNSLKLTERFRKPAELQLHGADRKRGGSRVTRGSEWGFKPRVLVLPRLTEEALSSRTLVKCFSGRLVAPQWGRREAGLVFQERVG